MTTFDILNLAGPPRPVPFLVRLRILFGGFISQFGWLFFGFGLIFVWVFTANMNLKGWLALRGELENTQGVITKIERHTASMGKHGTRIYYRHYYSFEGPDGVEYTGFSKQSFSRKVGEKVSILYPKDMPNVSKISGMQASVIGPMGLIPVVFPVIGLCLIIAAFRKGLKANGLLTNGVLGTGRLKSKKKTNTQINKQPVYKLTFEFSTPEGISYEVSAKTHLPEKLEDQQEEPLLYEPICPKNAVMLDNLPGAPRIDKNGNIRADSPLVVLLNLAIPVVSVIGHGVYIYIRFLGK